MARLLAGQFWPTEGEVLVNANGSASELPWYGM